MKALAGIMFLVGATGLAQQTYPFQNAALPMEQRIDNILSLMTTDEKIAGLGTSGVVVPRLGIRGTPIGEAISGVVLGGPMQRLFAAVPGASPERRMTATPTTQFPQGAGLARTWDRELMRKAGGVIGKEARYIWETGKNSRAFLVLLTPNADLARDPRWGRAQETYGEDPFLNGSMAAALIKGLQGDDPKYWQAASLLKHFLANSNEDGRYGSNSEFDASLMREYYSVPFRMGFQEGGARSYMASYNAWNGVPMTVHPMLKNVTVKEWGVDGIICTDAGSVGNLVNQHKTHADLKAATADSIKAGINMILSIREDYKTAVKGALADHLIGEADLDSALRGSLRTAIRLGLLDPPGMVPYSQLKSAPDPVASQEHKAIALQVAREAVVLLKNTGNLLPLNRSALKRVAVIGPRANDVLPDFYGGQPPYAVTPLDAIKAKLDAGAVVTYAAGNQDGAAEKAARAAEAAIVVVGNHPTCGREPMEMLQSLMVSKDTHCTAPDEGMESSDRASLTLEQEELVQAVYKANPKTVVVLVSSGPYAINWTQENVPAILHTSHGSQEEGNGIADVLFGDYNPAGRLTQTWVTSLEQLPPMMDYDIRHGRTYMYLRGEPLYPFGFGLSYTTFQYSDLRLASGTLRVNVKNTGSRDGDEVVQFYASYIESKVKRPLKQLVGFDRVHIARGQTKTVSVPLNPATLAYWDEVQNRFVVEPGEVAISASTSSGDARLKRIIVLK